MLLFESCFWYDDDYFGIIHEDVEERGLHYIFWNLYGCTRGPVLVCLSAGVSASQVELRSKESVVKGVMSNLKKLFPDQCPDAPVQSIVTTWGQDEYARMAYSYIGVNGTGDDYDTNQQPLAEERLRFAGEATCREFPATVAGAVKSGMREAALIENYFESREMKKEEKMKSSLMTSSEGGLIDSRGLLHRSLTSSEAVAEVDPLGLLALLEGKKKRKLQEEALNQSIGKDDTSNINNENVEEKEISLSATTEGIKIKMEVEEEDSHVEQEDEDRLGHMSTPKGGEEIGEESESRQTDKDIVQV